MKIKISRIFKLNKKTRMKASTLLHSFTLIIFTAFLSACSKPKEIEYKEFKNFKIENIGAANAVIKMDVVYYNPNNMGLQLKRTDLDIYIDGTYLGKTAQDYQISIPKKSNFTIPLVVNIDSKNILKNMFSSLFSKEVTIKVTGKVKVGKANIFINYPVNYEGKHKLGL